MKEYKLSFTINSSKGISKTYKISKPISVCRKDLFGKHSNAFSLPKVKIESLIYEDIFIGDVLP